MLRHDGSLSWPVRIVLALLVAAGLVVAVMSGPTTTILFLSYVLLGGFLAIQLPANPVTWIVIAIGFTFIGTTASPVLDTPV
jgi:hypothetical protein